MTKIKLPPAQSKLLIGGIVLGLLVVSVGAFVLVRLLPQEQKGGTTTSISADDIKSLSLDYVDSGDVDGGLKFFDDNLEKHKDNNEERRKLLLHKADFAQKMGRADVALETAKKADQIDSDIATTQALAKAYEAVGNKQEAVVYYKKMIDIVIESGDEMASSYVIFWEDKIRELEQ